MDNLKNIDWSLVRTFLAVAETGSLTAAAHKLGSSQPTVGRQVHALEALCAAELFHRHARGLELTDLGAALLPEAHKMHDAMSTFSIMAAGASQAHAGVVRITTSVFMAQYALPQIVADIRRAEPDIQIELVATDSTENLLFREADIAVRMYRPTQLDMIARHLGDISLGLFVSEQYAQHKGLPKTPDDLEHFDLIGYDRNELMIQSMREAGWPVTREWFNVRCDNQSAYWALVVAGCGIGFCQSNIARSTPGMVEVLPGLPIPELPVWLTAQQTMRKTPRVSRVWDLLVDGLAPFIS
ncbi:LysR family transcriptional regulator [Shimia sp. FJ5]|uniref:LysR family transcriptional regulator n=1 Tax=Shimia sp. FJ5 TaxID=3079054 RepID=UPI0026266EDF|nr:LysR family transcriptional regulator [Shimia sp. FJ5]MDV4146165.1 LysR family transcriptional regulator [Shimia sp. FJ5]